jgi:hypothetical protein
MAGPASLDPMALWRDAVAQWEKGINEAATQAMGTSEFTQGMHGAMGASLSVQKTVADLMGRYLTALNLPSRDEVAALGERLSGIESRLIRITTLLEHGPDATRPAGVITGVPRTKRPAVASEPPAPAKKTARRKPRGGA